MDKEHVQKAIEALKAQPKRKFTQSYDLIVNLKNIQVKQNPVDFFTTLHFSKGKEIKVAAFVNQSMHEEASKWCDLVIEEKDFAKYSDKKAMKNLAKQYDYFVAQAALMPKVAKAFGRVLGARGKMPNPKLGCVVPPNGNLEVLRRKLTLTVRMVAKKATNMQCMVGREDQKDEEIIDNILTVYKAVLGNVPNEIQNIKNVQLKLTMGAPVRI